jgi:biotin carboxylase
MKQRFAADGVPVPWFLEIGSVDELKRVVRQRPRPLVIKPVDSRGARGVLRLTERVDLDWAFNESLRHSPTGRVMVEQFLTGPQVSTESIVLDHVAHTPGFSDRNYEYLERFAPHIIENGGELPSQLADSMQRAVRALVTDAARSLGIRNGVVKGDIVIHDDEPYVIELAARLSGGYFCTHEIPLNTGVELVQHAIRLALGETPSASDLEPRYLRPVAQRYLFPQPGRVVRITGQANVAARPGIELCEVRVRAGDVIPATESHPARAGVVIATGETREQAVDRAEAAVAGITIHTRPVEQPRGRTAQPSAV